MAGPVTPSPSTATGNGSFFCTGYGCRPTSGVDKHGGGASALSNEDPPSDGEAPSAGLRGRRHRRIGATRLTDAKAVDGCLCARGGRAATRTAICIRAPDDGVRHWPVGVSGTRTGREVMRARVWSCEANVRGRCAAPIYGNAVTTNGATTPDTLSPGLGTKCLSGCVDGSEETGGVTAPRFCTGRAGEIFRDGSGQAGRVSL